MNGKSPRNGGGAGNRPPASRRLAGNRGQGFAPLFADRGHDHQACVRRALNAAGKLCLERHARLTEQRRQVLELVWSSHRPVTAYEILDRLDHNGRRPAPPMVYRALDFLLTQGLVHRVESRNAFIGCAQPGTVHLPEILLCTECGGAAEVADGAMAQALATQAAGLGFETHRQTIELSGRCADCRALGGDAGAAKGAGAETPANG